MFEIIDKIETQDCYYRAQVDDFEPIYQALEREEYLNVRDLALEQINNGCIDPRYIIYAKFGNWYESTSFDVSAEIILDLIKLHQFFLEKSDQGKIRIKAYNIIVEWLHTSMFTYAKFIRQNHDIYFDGDRKVLGDAFDNYISFVKENLPSINISQIYQLRDVCMTFQIPQEIEESNEDEDLDEENIEPSNNQKDYLEIYNSDSSYEWSRLLQNIEIYRKLVSEQSWLKAAVVYQVISSALKEFDPVKYFPGTFYPYLKDTANVYEHLMHQLSLSEHPLWSMLSQMFNSDPESFCKDDSLSDVRETLIKEVNNIGLTEQDAY
ncbi:type VI secretion system protein IglI family protein [Francisella sp. LA112445]|uniref:type VI secretion system protein IglI family protein n=1 Tax=Francisella sp. LA112445 TaxID=1395624 RepID=UPI001788E286|nr:type VI secretion system protein IglI family protein [Francisella sp. LA112445]QIW09682.1 hypothetical protein FIP56_02915 [Francisella sp. LA112445]